jgi:hypothetical protein
MLQWSCAAFIHPGVLTKADNGKIQYLCQFNARLVGREYAVFTFLFWVLYQILWNLNEFLRKVPYTVLSPHCVAFPMSIAANCSWPFVYCVIILCVSLLPHVYCFTVCVLAVLHTVVAGLLARSQYPEVPATGHLDTGFSWFPCV